MKKGSRQLLYGLIGAMSGLAGVVPLSRCGGHCTACFGCAGAGLGIVLILTGRWIRKGKERTGGMD